MLKDLCIIGAISLSAFVGYACIVAFAKMKIEKILNGEDLSDNKK